MPWDALHTLKWFLISAAITVGVTALLWVFLGPRALFAFLFLPFLPIRFGRRQEAEISAIRACPSCGRVSADPFDEYCPRDGARLVGR